MVRRYGGPTCYKTIQICDALQEPQKLCPFSSGAVIHIEADTSTTTISQRSTNAAKDEAEDVNHALQSFSRNSAIYRKIINHATAVNFGIYKVENTHKLSSPSYYMYVSPKDCFFELPEDLISLLPNQSIPHHFLSDKGIIYRIISLYLPPRHLHGYVIPLFPSICFIFNKENGNFIQVPVDHVKGRGQRISYGDIMMIIFQTWPCGGKEQKYPLPPCLYNGSCDDPR